MSLPREFTFLLGSNLPREVSLLQEKAPILSLAGRLKTSGKLDERMLQNDHVRKKGEKKKDLNSKPRWGLILTNIFLRLSLKHCTRGPYCYTNRMGNPYDDKECLGVLNVTLLGHLDSKPAAITFSNLGCLMQVGRGHEEKWESHVSTLCSANLSLLVKLTKTSFQS